MMGAFTYICGLIILGTAQGGYAVFIGAGLIIGFALACTGSAIAMAVASRSSPPAMRSMILGVVSAYLVSMLTTKKSQSINMNKQFWIGFGVCMVMWIGILNWQTIPEYTVVVREECIKT